MPCFDSVDQMAFFGFADGTCCHTVNLALVTWVLYSQAHDLASLGAVCIGPAINNIIEYPIVIGLLTKASSCDIDHLVVFMESQLVVSHFNNVYAIRKSVLL